MTAVAHLLFVDRLIVFRQVTLGKEVFAAYGADEFPDSFAHVHCLLVESQSGVDGVAFATNLTLPRCGDTAFALFVMTFPIERTEFFPTYFAGKRLLSCVGKFVQLQSSSESEEFLTDITLVPFAEIFLPLSLLFRSFLLGGTVLRNFVPRFNLICFGIRLCIVSSFDVL